MNISRNQTWDIYWHFLFQLKIISNNNWQWTINKVLRSIVSLITYYTCIIYLYKKILILICNYLIFFGYERNLVRRQKLEQGVYLIVDLQNKLLVRYISRAAKRKREEFNGWLFTVGQVRRWIIWTIRGGLLHRELSILQGY